MPRREAARKRSTSKRASAAGGTRASKKQAPARATTRYSDPALRERLKRRILASDKGGARGTWSARKAQLLAHEYEKHGGRYRGGRGAAQKSLQRWSSQDWTTADGRRARRGRTTARYLPRGAWARLSPSERKATDAKKRAGAAKGRRKVANTAPAKRAASAARRASPARRRKSR